MRFFTTSLLISFCLFWGSGIAQSFVGTPQTIVSQQSPSNTDVGQNNSILVINGKPAIGYQAKGSGFYYIRATDVLGTDWSAAPVLVAAATTLNPISLSNLSGEAGNPMLAFNTNVTTAIRLKRASHADGDAWGDPTTTIASRATGEISLAIVDGFPAVSFYDPINYDLVYVRATNAEGTAWASAVILDNGASGDSRGRYSTLLVADGRPAVAYYNTLSGELMYVRANDASGTSWPAPQVVDTDGNNGRYASMSLIDGRPAIAYHNFTSGNLRYVRANDATGSSWGTPQTLDSGDDTGYNVSLASVNGVPAISYITKKTGKSELRFIHGLDAEGNTWTSPQVLDEMTTGTSPNDYSHTSLAEVNGTPAISYYDIANKDLKYIRSTVPVYMQSGPPILYVKVGGTGDGTSWADAMGDIQAAIDAPGVEQVWVAKGTYYPAAEGLKMKNDVAIYGGFPDNDDDAGTNERDWDANPTILDGNNEGRVVNNEFEESDPLTASAILDGFTITGGNSSYASGIVNLHASPTMTNLMITANTSTGEGGAMYNGECSPMLINVTITGNSTSTSRGGGIYNENASPLLTDVTISGNSAQIEGGGIYNRNSSPSLLNVTISDNHAQSGGGISNDNSSPVLTNVLIYGNSSIDSNLGGGGIYNGNGSSPTLINVTITGNSSFLEGGAIFENESSSLIYNSIIWNNGGWQEYYGAPDPASSHNIIGGSDPLFVDAGGSDYRLSISSPAINAGSNDAYGDLSGAKDLDGNPRRWGAAIDMGAYENQDASLPVTLVHFEARKQENMVQLSWQTTEEVNASHFEVQRSNDAKSWQAIGRVAARGSVAGEDTGHGGGNYVFTDNLSHAALTGLSHAVLTELSHAVLTYYRLKMVDRAADRLDGTYDYSMIRAVSFTKTGNTVSRNNLYPNPSARGTVILEMADSQVDPVIRIFDGSGREVPVRVTGRSGKFYLETAGLLPGMYHVQVQTGKERRTMQLVIQ